MAVKRPFFRGFVKSKKLEETESTVSCLSPLQQKCFQHCDSHTLVEQDLYMKAHPEILLLLKAGLTGMQWDDHANSPELQYARFFQRPVEELQNELNNIYGESFVTAKLAAAEIKREKDKARFMFKDLDMKRQLKFIIMEELKSSLEISSSSFSSFTTSSSFLSVVSEPTTLKTPEPEAEPVMTISQIILISILAATDKATKLKVTEEQIKYDTGYVLLSEMAENAMEIAVKDIKEDIRQLYKDAYRNFMEIIDEKQRQADAIAWEFRMRKKLKRMLRRQKNFRGYETPPLPKSEISLHPSYKLSPQQICVCHPKPKYNRYPKDRFGIYLPSPIKYDTESVTVSADDGVDIEI